ncbi:hypothetical protein CLV59_1011001 [Chitinophaga dinghuensis]|uniref:Uncharacterized protein n=1 Tax=Chitinophaga dinghuensis TaxID=1539050 RepID=A0A327WC97_9BACT|nr:hypothetical protein [Chitinophaga dinghuensis]RAJ88233.1 hypothetical protein CLV59_1011001 [Chitinophaga dinghuensis]
MEERFKYAICILLFSMIFSNCKVKDNHQLKYRPNNYLDNYRDSFGSDYFSRSIQMRVYVDSIDNLDPSSIPYFVFDECFDLQPVYWKSLHTPMSLRLYVIERVKSRFQIEKLMTTLQNVEKFDSCKSDYKIPFKNKSFFDLLKIDLERRTSNRKIAAAEDGNDLPSK